MATKQDQSGHDKVLRQEWLRNMPEEIKCLPYFYPDLNDSKSATKRVEQFAKGPGYFLLRLSSKGDNYLSLSVSINEKSVRHVNVIIERKPSLMYYIVEQVRFATFHQLRSYYGEHRICNLEKISNVKLLHSIDKSSHPSGIPIQSNGDAPVSSRKHSDTLQPKTPNSQTLTPMFAYAGEADGFVDQRVNGNEQYLGGTVSPPEKNSGLAGVRRKISNPNRPLPKPPKETEEDDATRPPCPLPPLPGYSEYYSRPRDENVNMLPQLREVLKESELGVCDCGILLCDSELPQGWTLHISNGCLFYQNELGETTWTLPAAIIPEITLRQRSIIVKLSQQNGKRPPAALMAHIHGGQGQVKGHTQGHLNGNH